MRLREGNGASHKMPLWSFHNQTSVSTDPTEKGAHWALLKPMDQGMISIFKDHYSRRAFAKLVTATNDDQMTVQKMLEVLQHQICHHAHLSCLQAYHQCMVGCPRQVDSASRQGRRHCMRKPSPSGYPLHYSYI
ncbi:uncharacterized protein [Panulirus ornatus]|uniref:uncharacterized protein isoform X1 n=1 Tax=Panulirus ornatus TaxID=150431 RepID=UPI003A882692